MDYPRNVAVLNADVYTGVCEVVADAFAVDATRLTPDTGASDVAGWDSIGHLNLVSALEERFDISFNPEEFAELQSIHGIVTAIAAKRRQC